MNLNFFNAECSEPATIDELFGICDDQDNTKAYTDNNHPEKWIAIVKNENPLVEVTFTAIDNCNTVLQKGTKNKESTCDGMLTFSDHLYLVELKDQMTGGWIPTAIGQLENTMKILIATHDLTLFRYKKAFACNKKHTRFAIIESELNKWFFITYGFRLDIQSEIIIK